MRSFKCPEDLKQVPPSDPAYPLLAELVQSFTTYDGYDPDADGWVVLIDAGDIGQPLTDLWDDWTLMDVPWEGVLKVGAFYEGIFLANNQFGIVFVIPDEPWLPKAYRARLEYYLDSDCAQCSHLMEHQTPEEPMTTEDLRVLRQSTCPSLSGASTLTYEIGADAEGGLYFRITGNSGGGLFGKEWVAWRAIEPALADSPVTAGSLKRAGVCTGKSQNTPGFVLAALKAEGLVTSLEQGGHTGADPAAWLAEMQALIQTRATQATAEALTMLPMLIAATALGAGLAADPRLRPAAVCAPALATPSRVHRPARDPCRRPHPV